MYGGQLLPNRNLVGKHSESCLDHLRYMWKEENPEKMERVCVCRL